MKRLAISIVALGMLTMPARLSDNVFFQGRAAWGRSTNDISPFQTDTDAFDTERWLATGTLKGRCNMAHG